jgi:hypothetical protein
MKKPKLALLFESVTKIAVCFGLITAAASEQQYSFYIFIRWFVMAPFIYFCYKSYVHENIGLVIYFGTVAILFNPFNKFWFQKSIWQLIDSLVVAITILTVILDLTNEFQRINRKTKYENDARSAGLREQTPEERTKDIPRTVEVRAGEKTNISEYKPEQQ